MKKTVILISALSTSICIFGQMNTSIEKPDSITIESDYQLFPSKIFIPIEISEAYLKNLINESTPLKQQIRDRSRTQEVNVEINIADKETTFNGVSINHNVRLTNGDGYFKKRSCINTPFGNVCSPWIRVDCDDIRGNASVVINTLLNKDFTISATGKLKAEIDNAQCSQFNITGILRAFNWHKFEQNLNSTINQELKKINIKNQVAEIWNMIQNPHKINNDFFILIKPKEILYKDLSFENGSAKTSIGLNFFATTGNLNDSSNWNSNIPLPELIKNPELNENNFELNLPINLPYTLLDKTAKEKLTGLIIKGKNKRGKEKKYAKILDVEIYGSKEIENDIVIGLKTKVYRTIFKREKVPVYIHAKIVYDTVQKSLFVSSYKLDSKTESGLYNISLEAIANRIVYNKIIDKLKFEIDEAIYTYKKIANRSLEDKIEITKGVELSGVVNNLEIKKIIPQPDRILCVFTLKGNVNIEVLTLK